MPRSSRQPSPSNRGSRPRGRTGGRAGGAGYDFQDVYIAWQLAKMLMGDRDPIVEVLWEKKAVDSGRQRTPESVYVDDAIIRLRSGRWIYSQVKETIPTGGWSARNLVATGVAGQLWQQWHAKDADDRKRTVLQIVARGSVAPLALISDAALRSRTPSELMSDESAEATAKAIQLISQHLSASKPDTTFLEFLKAFHPVSLPEVDELYGWIVQTLAASGAHAAALADHLIRIVAASKHSTPSARSGHTRDSLIEQLRVEGVSQEILAALGLAVIVDKLEPGFWSAYRAAVVSSLRTFRVYGLALTNPVLADLPSLYIPLRLQIVHDRKEEEEEEERPISPSRSLVEALEQDRLNDPEPESRQHSARHLADVLTDNRRFLVVGTQGSGKTTTLRWLAIISAMEGDEGRRMREQTGLPSEPLTPVFVRFRRLSDRVEALKRHGIRGRVGFIADFLAAEFQAGFGAYTLNDRQALRVAYELLESKNTLLLFDALDEVPDEAIRNQLIQSVADLLERFPEPRVVLTSRPYALMKDQLQVTLPRYTPLAFDSRDTEAFCRQWYSAIRPHLSDGVDDAEAARRAAHLAKEARRLPDFAQSPLLLSILALVHFNHHGALPVQRAPLYDFATTAMLGHWERDPARNPGDDGIPSDWSSMLGIDDAGIRSVTEQLAYDVQMSEAANEIGLDEAVESLKRGIGALSCPPQSLREKALLFFRLLEQRAGLIQERVAGVYGFVHLGLQEYLAARWVVVHGDTALQALPAQAEKEQHSEVIRFVAGILSSDLQWRNPVAARGFVLSLAAQNAVLAGACLLEAPQIEMCEDESQELARGVWSDAWHYFHHRADIIARLIWGLLARSSDPDRLLLELIASDDLSRRHPGGFEATFVLLALRPAGDLSPALLWFLRRLAAAVEEHGPPVAPICSLLLVEAGVDPVGRHLDELISLLSPHGWMIESRTSRDFLADRAEALLRAELDSADARQVVKARLYCALLENPDSAQAKAVARFLVAIGEPVNQAFADALITSCIESRWDSEFRSWVVGLAATPEIHSLLVRGLSRSWTDGDPEVREVVLQTLEKLGVDTRGLLSVGHGQIHVNGSACEPNETLVPAGQFTAALADDLWLDSSEDKGRIWTATIALLNAGRADVPGIHRALVRVGLASSGDRESAHAHLLQLSGIGEHHMSVRAALLDALDSENGTVAAAAASVLLDIGDTLSSGQMKRIVTATMRDPNQVPGFLPRIRAVLQGDHRDGAIATIAEILKQDAIEATVAGPVACLLADEGCLSAAGVAEGLVLGGLSEPSLHDRVLPHIKEMLEDPELVTPVRKALTRALESGKESLAWGAVKCLWSAGMRFEPGIVSAICEEGLESKNAARSLEASSMVQVLLGEPITAPSTMAALRERIASLLQWREKEYTKAWPAARCLLLAGAVADESLPGVLVHGGVLGDNPIDEIIDVSRGAVSINSAFAERVKEELAKEIERSEKAWRAVEVLDDLFPSSIGCAIRERSNLGRAVVRALVHSAEDNARADSLLIDLMRETECRSCAIEAMVRLLKDKEESIAFGAACRLVDEGKLEHLMLPKAIIRGGFTSATRYRRAEKLLDRLGGIPSMSLPRRAALNEALLSSDSQTAWNTAIYLLDRGEPANTGIARALVHGGFSHGWAAPRAAARRRLKVMLNDPLARSAAEEALVVRLFDPDSGDAINFEVASILVAAGFDPSEALALAVDENARWLAAPMLALVALSGRIEDAQDAARRAGARELLAILGAEAPDVREIRPTADSEES